MILRPHPAYKHLSCAIHPGAPARTTPRGKVTAPAVPAHVAFTVGYGRNEITDPRELRRLAHCIDGLADDLEHLTTEPAAPVDQLDLFGGAG